MPSHKFNPKPLADALRASQRLLIRRGVPLRAFLLRPLWLPVLLLLMVAFTVGWSVIRNATYADLVHRSQTNLTLSEHILADVINLETGQRGFIITLDPQFLKPYTAARRRLPQDLSGLRNGLRFMAGETLERNLQQLDRIEGLINEWERSGGGLALRLVRNDYAAAVQQVRSGRGKRLVDSIRQTISTYQQDERARQQRLQRESTAALRFALVVTVLGVLLATLVLYVILHRTATSVARVLQSLTNTTTDIAQGEVDPPLPPHAITEVAALASNLNHMGQELVQRERERDSTLAALRVSLARHRALINAIPDILVRVNADGEIVTFKPPADVENPEWVNAMVGHRIPEVLPPHVAEPLMKGLQDSLRENKQQRAEFSLDMQSVIPNSPALVDYETRFVPVSKEEVLIIARDISERKHVERLKNEFVSTVSHELRTPLTSIRGSLSLIASGSMGELQPRGKKLVDIALNNSERLVRLINDLLDIEKIESGKLEFHMQQVDLAALVQHAVEDNRAYAQQFGVDLETASDGTAPSVWGDEDRLLQVLTNLISNAVKFSPKGSAVTISTALQERRVQVSVRDRGPGIPQEFRSRIFGRFAQADSTTTREKGGTGLGLSISKAIVDRHDGRISFEDHPEGGTIFSFELPVSVPIPPPETARPAAQVNDRVLVCEDDRDVAHLLQLILHQAGFDSDAAYTAAEAEGKLAGQHYDALILDLILPDHDGVALIRQLRNQPQTATLPIIVVSAVAEERQRLVSGDAISVLDWITKPVDTTRLLSAVRLASRQNTGKALRILHVDDDADLRQVVQEVLRGVATLEHAESLGQARQMLRGQPFDLVLLDPGLPDGNGLDLLAELREKSPPVPVLVFSAGELDREHIERVTATLVKSRTSNEQLLATIRALIHPAFSPGGSHD